MESELVCQVAESLLEESPPFRWTQSAAKTRRTTESCVHEALYESSYILLLSAVPCLVVTILSVPHNPFL